MPPALLSRLRLTPYTIHPGSPDYPGSHPEGFAIWEQAPAYGVTAHEMTERVDEGPIVVVDRFAMSPRPERTALSMLAYSRAIEMFALVAAHCAETDAPMRRVDEDWAPRKRTRNQFRVLCRRYGDAAQAERERLRRACGEALAEPVPA